MGKLMPFNRTDFPVQFGQRLKVVRAHRRMTQPALAHATGFVTGTICNLERGITVPSLFAVFVLADALGVHPKILLFGEEE